MYLLFLLILCVDYVFISYSIDYVNIFMLKSFYFTFRGLKKEENKKKVK